MSEEEIKGQQKREERKAEEVQLKAGLESRCKEVFNFDAIKVNSSKREEQPKDDDDNKEEEKKAKEEVKERKGQESLFRVPDTDFKLAGKRAPRALYEPPKRDRSRSNDRGSHDRSHRRGRGGGGFIPDHRKNPDKYTKYSLKDVDLVNNRSNTQAAFDFLREVRERGQEPEEKFEVTGSEKIVFKKREKKVGGECSTSKEPKKKEEKKKKAATGMSLSHLMDEEDEDDE